MKKITREVLNDAANRLLFTMSDEQYETLEDEFRTLIKQMGKIGEISDLDEYEPMTFPEEPLPRDVALKNAGNKQDNQIKLPKVVL